MKSSISYLFKTKLFSLRILASLLFCMSYFVGVDCQFAHDQELVSKVITVENPIQISRYNETISLSATIIKEAFPNQQVQYLTAKESNGTKSYPTQSIDYNQDGIIDEFLFQSDFKPNEVKEFVISCSKDSSSNTSLVYAAYMPSVEGMQDFTWENELIGYRYYGKERSRIQHTGIAMDIWCKRVPELLTHKWYIPDQSYHEDIGYGADHYPSGSNQGCGGTGIYIDDSIYFSKSFSGWKIIANGPIRLIFELEFLGWAIDTNILETKRISLDAGHYFNKYECKYSSDIENTEFMHAVGFVQREDSKNRSDQELGWFAAWESLGEENGNLGTGFIQNYSGIVDIEKRDNHIYCFLNPKKDKTISYYTGAVWSEYGQIKCLDNWEEFIKNQVKCIRNPCLVTLVN